MPFSEECLKETFPDSPARWPRSGQFSEIKNGECGKRGGEIESIC